MKTEKISYYELARRVGEMILCNNISQVDENLYDNLENGGEQPEDWNEKEDGEYEMPEIYQFYLIDKSGADYLKRNTNEIIYYSELLDLWVWGITHFGTSWDGVFTELKNK